MYLDEIFNFSHEEIVNALLDQKRQPIKLKVPMVLVFDQSSNEYISLGYLQMAYAGELLNVYADRMTYKYKPPVREFLYFSFKLWFSNIEGMAQALFDIALPFYECLAEEDKDVYYQGLEAFIEQIEKAPESAVCQDFVKTYLEYKGKAG